MGPIEGPAFERLTSNDMSDCLALSAEAGWNQTREDWALFLDHSTVLGLRDDRGRAVASGAVLPYPNGFAWISMVLVTASRRRERIGTRILQACCAEVVRQGLLPVLDATPAGEQVYRPLGFQPMFGISRWQGNGGGRGSPPAGLRAMMPSDIPRVAEIDAAAFGADRSFLIESFFVRAPRFAFVTGSLDGFVVARPGRLATQIGPIVAADEAAALALLNAALDTISGPVFLDLAEGWDGMTRVLRQRSFTVQRPFVRMALNRSLPLGDPARLFVVGGPEFG
jgi:GNAT superfamily N-acetyltransferase